MSIKQKILASFLAVALTIGFLGGFAFYHDIETAERISVGQRFLLFSGAALLLSLLVGYILSHHIAKPLQALKKASLAVGEGNLDIRVDHRGNDELGMLADSFNAMMEGLKQSRDELLRTHEKIKTESIMRNMSEKALLESEQKLWTMFEYASDAFFILDMKGNFIDANQTAYERLGYTKQELLSMHVSQLDPPEFAKKVPARMAQLAVQGKAVFESAHVRKDGSIMPVEINARSIDRGGEKVVFSAIRDITERKLAEDAIRTTNARLSALIQAIPDMVFFKDREGKHLLVNKAVEKILGHTQEEMRGKSVLELMPPGPAGECKMSDDRAMQLRVPVHVEEALTAQHGEVRRFDIVKVPIFDSENNIAGLVSIGHDITERKRVEEELHKHREQLMVLVDERTSELKKTNEKLLAEITERERMEVELLKAQKIESLGVLAGGIAHDFNNMLTTVMGNVSLALLDLDEGHPVRKPLTEAERALLRAQELTQQLLTFSKGGAPVKRASSIGDILREAIGFALRGSRVRCEFILSDDLWLIDADEGQMSQVIHNLAINADQAMPEGGTINVRCENVVLADGAVPLLRPGRYVKVTIEDSGVGISRDHLSKIFDPYFTTKQRGSGLGLATTYSIIQKHGGHIAVASEIGVGATFTLYLPASSSVKASKRVEDAQPLPKASGTILIMDDEEGVRQATGAVLRRLGYTVSFAEEGGRAIELYRKAMEAGASFDLVIMDLTIPGGMGGRETLQRLKELDPTVKAIVSSGYSNDPIMAEFRDYGFAGVVAKPYRVKELSEAVSRVISERNPAISDKGPAPSKQPS